MVTRWTTSPRLTLLGAVALSLTIVASPAPCRAAGSARVTGGGQYFGPFGHIVVSVNAIQHNDGSVSGEFEQIALPDGGNSRGGVPNVHGQVNCLYVEGNTAFIGGVLTSVKNLDPQFGIQAGLPFYLAVQDNSHGHGAVPDQVSPFTVTEPGTFGLCSDAGLDAFLESVLVPLSTGSFRVGP